MAFRYHTKKRADILGIYGYVRNLDNGDVEVLAMGDPENIEIFEEFLKRGPYGASVKSLEKRDGDLQDPGSSFEIIR